jgi:hypothetical protein
MGNSARIGLPYLDAAQAQKHVTMNEALALLDVAASARVEAMGAVTPPTSPVDGDANIVGDGAGGDWTNRDGEVAVFLNGGWEFIAPWAGWRLWVADQAGEAFYDGQKWQLAHQPVSAGGAVTAQLVAEIDHVIAPGATSLTAAFIPDKAIVLGVTSRVIAPITGAIGWQMGVNGSPDRYGSGIGVAANSYAHGVTGSPQAYYGGSSLLLTAEGADFTGGAVRMAVHYFDLSPPREV